MTTTMSTTTTNTTTTTTNPPIIIVGMGCIGTRHAQMLHTHYPDFPLYYYKRPYTKAPDYMLPLQGWQQVRNCLSTPPIVFICTPTHTHLDLTLQALHSGARAVWLEKPIDCVWNEKKIDRICDYISNGRTVYVGYDLRFNKIITQIKTLANKYLQHPIVLSACCETNIKKWRKSKSESIASHLTHYSTSEHQGGGVLLELSHELYYCEQILGPVTNIIGIRTRASNWATVDTDDFVMLFMQHGLNRVSQIKLNMAHTGEEQRTINIKISTLTDQKGWLGTNFISLTEPPDYIEDGFLKQLQYFMSNYSNPNLDGGFLQCLPLYKRLIEFRENTSGGVAGDNCVRH